MSAANKVWELDNAVTRAAQSADTREWFQKCLGGATSRTPSNLRTVRWTGGICRQPIRELAAVYPRFANTGSAIGFGCDTCGRGDHIPRFQVSHPLAKGR